MEKVSCESYRGAFTKHSLFAKPYFPHCNLFRIFLRPDWPHSPTNCSEPAIADQNLEEVCVIRTSIVLQFPEKEMA